MDNHLRSQMRFGVCLYSQRHGLDPEPGEGPRMVAEGDGFGFSVALAEDTALVGAYRR